MGEANIRLVKAEIKALAAKSKFIKEEELTLLRMMKHALIVQDESNYESTNLAFIILRAQRIVCTARASRASLIAYGFLKEKSYAKIERPRRKLDTEYNYCRGFYNKTLNQAFSIAKMHKRGLSMVEFKAWIEDDK